MRMMEIGVSLGKEAPTDAAFDAGRNDGVVLLPGIFCGQPDTPPKKEEDQQECRNRNVDNGDNRDIVKSARGGGNVGGGADAEAEIDGTVVENPRNLGKRRVGSGGVVERGDEEDAGDGPGGDGGKDALDGGAVVRHNLAGNGIDAKANEASNMAPR